MKITTEDKTELYQYFIQQMLEDGYSPYYIGQQLALIIHAIDLGETVAPPKR